MASPQQLLAELESSFSPLSDVKAYGKFMIYGPSGSGKTVWAMRLAQAITEPGKDIIYIDAVEGWTSLLNHPELLSRVRHTVFQGLTQIETLCMALEANAGSFSNVGCILLDEYSTMARKDVDVVLTARARKDTDKDPDVASFTDTGSSTRRMDRGTAQLLKVTRSGIHIILLAHERKDKDKTNIEVTSPAFMPAFNGIVKADMHVVGRLTATDGVDTNGNPVYRWSIQVHPTRQVDAKSRVGGLAVHNDPAKFIKTAKTWLEGSGTTEEEDRKPVNNVIEVEAETDDGFGGILVD